MGTDNAENRPPPASAADPTQRSAEDVFALRDAIMDRARRQVDPGNTGFDPRMSIESFPTDDMLFRDWWDWVERIVKYILVAATRVTLGIITAGGVIGAAQLYGTPAGSQYAGITLGISALFGAWFVVSTVRTSFTKL
jgi:hypothetical protein